MNDHRSIQQRLAVLPSVHTLLQHPSTGALCARYSRSRVVAAARDLLRDIRTRILENPEYAPDPEDLADHILAQRIIAHLTAPPARNFRPVINASGILFHPALGSAPVSEAARAAMADALGPVVHDERDRESCVEGLLCRITDAEDALVVHAPLAALWLAIETFGRGREVIISRGQLGAVDGAVRIMDLFQRCDTRIVEVGATNKTHLKDYHAAICDRTGAICVIRPTTYTMRGFTYDVPADELARLGKEAGIPIVHDIGHATLTPMTQAAWHPAVSVRESAHAGVAVTVIGGEGLVGGPACGLMAGQREAIDRMRRNPLYHMLRAGTVTYAGLEAMLRQYDPEAAGFDHHPAGWMISVSAETVKARASRLLKWRRSHLSDTGVFDLTGTIAYLTASRLPSEAFPSYAVTVRPSGCDTAVVVERLYHHVPALLAARGDDGLVLDLRAVQDDQIEQTYRILRAVLKNACAN